MIAPTGTGNDFTKIFIRSEISRRCRPVTAWTAGKDPPITMQKKAEGIGFRIWLNEQAQTVKDYLLRLWLRRCFPESERW